MDFMLAVFIFKRFKSGFLEFQGNMKKLLVFISLIILVSCEYEKIPTPPKPHIGVQTDSLVSVFTDKPVTISSSQWNSADFFIVSLSDIVKNNIENSTGVLNSTGTYNGLLSFNDGKTIQLTLKSLYDSTNIYILAEWNDSSLNASGRTWLWDGPADPLKSDDPTKWSLQNNDDKLILKFDLPSPQTFKQDIWEWSVALSEPLGFAIDMLQKSDNSVTYDAGTPMFAKNSNGSNFEPAYEYDGNSQIITRSNGAKGTLDPSKFLINKTSFSGDPVKGKVIFDNACAECHGDEGYAPKINELGIPKKSRSAIKNFILDPDLHGDGFSHVEGLTDLQLDDLFAWLKGKNGIPGFYLQNPTGSVADVKTVSNVTVGAITLKNKNGYKVLFVRKLDTQNSDDIKFETKQGNSYKLNISLCNNDSINFVGSLNQNIVFKYKWDEK